MARPLGTNAKPPASDDWLAKLRRVMGLLAFLTLASIAMCILGAVVLAPEYAAMVHDQYARDCKAVQTEQLKALIAAQNRMEAAASQDVDFIKRLAEWYCDLLPTNEEIKPSGFGAPPPGIIIPAKIPNPVQTQNVLTRIAEKLQNAGTRRGLCLVAGGLMLAAMSLFSGLGSRKRAA